MHPNVLQGAYIPNVMSTYVHQLFGNKG